MSQQLPTASLDITTTTKQTNEKQAKQLSTALRTLAYAIEGGGTFIFGRLSTEITPISLILLPPFATCAESFGY